MSGEAIQPGGRPPAPGELALVQAFINTHYDLEHVHGAELLADPAALARWLRERDLVAGRTALDRRELDRALALREGLRELARGDRRALARLNDAARGAVAGVTLSVSGPRFVAPADAGLDGAVGRLLAIVAAAMIDGSWSRLKICPGDDCGWAFYDHSRNQTGRWCSMSVCGGRAKARAHYRRRRRTH
ncbi:MAG TPA: CGNR zinc finger domain-containing protein [Solirubrobacteraceae bacterium]|jgi:predicted RNA-binding Zn ribbon-like protein|nr:CGNR zinc finger domain-containing protein [Solirubrobacteraceae bacterium]